MARIHKPHCEGNEDDGDGDVGAEAEMPRAKILFYFYTDMKKATEARLRELTQRRGHKITQPIQSVSFHVFSQCQASCREIASNRENDLKVGERR